MLQDCRIGFIGAGQMAEAIIAGLLNSGLISRDRITATDVMPQRCETLHSKFGISTSTDNAQAVLNSNLVCLCIEPQVLDGVLTTLGRCFTPTQLIISVAAGYPLARLAGLLGPQARLVRAMPNTPSNIGQGVTALCCAASVEAQGRDQAVALFNSIGKVRVVEERLMDAVTGLSGSGPAYVFTMIEALADGGVLMGLPRQTAQLLAAQTVAGAARMVLERGEHPAVLKDRVASPGGTTIAGLAELEAGTLRATLIDAVEAATRRSQELGRQDTSYP